MTTEELFFIDFFGVSVLLAISIPPMKLGAQSKLSSVPGSSRDGIKTRHMSEWMKPTNTIIPKDFLMQHRTVHREHRHPAK
jgi:hypothetical protein